MFATVYAVFDARPVTLVDGEPARVSCWFC